jgi:hypothetical protein
LPAFWLKRVNVDLKNFYGMFAIPVLLLYDSFWFANFREVFIYEKRRVSG